MTRPATAPATDSPAARPTDRSPSPGTAAPSPRTAVPPPSPLRDFYENPDVPVASGRARGLRQALMLADALGALGPTGAGGTTGTDRRQTGTDAHDGTDTSDETGGGRGLATVLDIGCGDGSASAAASVAPAGHRVIGVDWSQDALRRAAHRIPHTVRGELTDGGLPFRSRCADAVVFSEVIEHLVDPDAALDEVRRVLRPGGHLMLSTPNLAAWYNRGLLLAGVQPVFSEVSMRGIHGRPGSQVVGHLRLYTARALRGFLAASGFEVVRIAGAPYHDVPRPLRPLDRAACRFPSLASILLVHARRGRE